jgi:tRNA(fMet)-specific endonuclease VapC
VDTRHQCLDSLFESPTLSGKGPFPETRRDDNPALLDELIHGFCSFPFDGNAAYHFGRIRAELSKAGTPIGPCDLQIAAIALSHGLTLLTHNTREFSRVAGLNLEDWET